MTPSPNAESGRVRVALQVAVCSGAIPDEARLCDWIATALGDQPNAEVTLRIVTEAESAELNRRFRGRGHATNVLSFPAAADWPELDGEPRSLGDLVVCAPIVEREAREQGKTAEAHWAHIVIHGALHLLGLDHQAGPEALEMENRERELLAGFGFADPYTERR